MFARSASKSVVSSLRTVQVSIRHTLDSCMISAVYLEDVLSKADLCLFETRRPLSA